MNYTKRLLSVAFIALIFSSCDTDELARIQDKNGIVSDDHSDNDLLKEIRTIEIDSCEYLTSGRFYNRTLTHKGNCKFCEQIKGR